MKLRNFIIVLLAVLMAFAFASCKNDPTPPGPTPPGPEPTDEVYQLEITEGVDKDYWNRDKLKIVWNEPVEQGDTITLKYRSERGIYQWDIRNEDASLKWVYESKKNGFEDPVLGDDGWYTLTYTFPANDIDGNPVNYATAGKKFGIYFRGNFVTTDLIEIKDIELSGDSLDIVAGNIISKATLNEEPVEHDWTKKNWAVLFATGTVGEVDKTPIAEKVLDGGKVTGAPVAKEGYTLTIYNDASRTSIFDPETPITEEKIFYYSYVGIPRTVQFETNGGSTIDPVTVANGDLLEAPEAPTKEGVAFKAWYKEAELVNMWDFTSQVLDDMTLYAAYGEPVEVTFELNGGAFPEGVSNVKIVAKGNPVAYPADDPTNGSKMFLGWYADEELSEEYDFSKPVEEPISIYAAWVEATKVTLVDGDKVEIIDVPLDVAMDAPDVVDDKIGYVFGGWYDDATFETEHDFTAIVTEPFTIYACWEEAVLYQLTALNNGADDLYGYDKLAVVQSTVLASDRDVLSFRYRTTKQNTGFSIRRAGGGKKWIYQNTDAANNYGLTSYEVKDDGWIYCTYVFDHTTAVDSSSITGKDENFELHFFNRYDDPKGNAGIEKGDILEIQDLALNGVEGVITASDVAGYAGASLAIIEGGSYVWADVAVTFVTGEHAGAIDPETVKFGSRIDAPEIKPADGYAFAGWYADEAFTEEFNFALPIIEATSIYAKIDEARTVTFDTNGGSEIEPVVLAKGEAVARPDDPTSDGYVFGGWYKESTLDTLYDFSTPVVEDITLYACWISSKKLTLNLNYADAPAATVLDVEAGVAITEPKDPARAGYFFDGWFKDDKCSAENEFDFAGGIESDTVIYAKWVLPENLYKFTATQSADRFQLRFKGSSVAMLSSIQPGDEITFMVRFTTELTPASYRVRTYDGEKEISGGKKSLPEAVDGWYTVTVVAPESGDYIGKNGLYVQFFASANWAIGDVCEIMALAYNGTEIPISLTSSSSGAYEGVYPTVEEVPLDN